MLIYIITRGFINYCAVKIVHLEQPVSNKAYFLDQLGFLSRNIQ